MKEIPTGTLYIKGGFGIERILDVTMREYPGEHSFAEIKGTAGIGENGHWGFEGVIANESVELYVQGEEMPLYIGIIQEAELEEENGLHLIKLHIASGSILLDLKKKSRSYQDAGQSYGQVIDKVLEPWDTAAIYPRELDERAIGFPIIQYRETDWEFLKRLASRFYFSLYPEPVMGGAKLYLGIPETGAVVRLDEDEYTVHMDRRFYDMGGEACGLSRRQFITYEVTSSECCRVGDRVVFLGQELFICAKSGRSKGGLLTFTYVLSHSDWAMARRLGNQRLSGLSLLGTVEGCEHETVRLNLDIDAGQAEQPLYPWNWVPATGNVMYMMPQRGTRVSLYFKGEDEESGIAVNCIRSGGGCAGVDYRDKSLITEHGMKLRLSQSDMGFETLTSRVLLDDVRGIRVEGNGGFHVMAAGDVRISGETVKIRGEQGVALCRGVVRLEKEQGPSVEVGSKLELSGKEGLEELNSRGKSSTYYLTWEHEDYSNPSCRYRDEPVEGKYDTGKLARNVLGGIGVVVLGAIVFSTLVGAVVEAAVTVTAVVEGAGVADALGASLTVAGSAALSAGEMTLIGGSLYVGGRMVSDVLSGHISSAEEYRRAALLGSVTGFLTGALGLVMEEAGLAANAAAGFGVGFTEGAADSYLRDGEIDWESSIKSGVFAAAMSLVMFKWHEGRIEGGGGAEKIRTQAELDALAADPAHGGKIGAKSIAERDVGLGLESQGKVDTLIRDPSGSAEFIDTVTGQKWDVKAFNSQYAPKGYNLNDAMTNIKKSLAANENVMLDTRNLTVTDLQELISEIAKQGLSDKVLTWP